jgi:hypothetical protein
VEGEDLVPRDEVLFQTIVHPGTGKPYTNTDMVRMSLGVLLEQEVEGSEPARFPTPR